MKREVTITISVEDVKDFFNCPTSKANQIWDELEDIHHDLEQILKYEAISNFRARLSKYIQSK